jgi:gliding motility-associated-like protein
MINFSFYNFFFKLNSLLFITFNLFLSVNLSASHGAGGEITYRCLGDNRYEFTLTFYKDCGPSAYAHITFNAPIIGLNLLPEGDPSLAYVWSPALGFISPLTEPNPLVSPGQSIQYTAAILSENCSAEYRISVDVLAGPLIESITANPEVLTESGESMLIVNATGDYIGLEWSPAELLDNPFVSNPVAFVESTTTFTVVLTDANGCTDSGEVVVLLEKRPCEPPFIFLPNAFSPNGDGVNDILYVRGEDIVNMELRIYNRYGQELFFSNDKGRGWDGTFQAEELAPGVYSYHLLVECTDGVVNELRGNVNLIR